MTLSPLHVFLYSFIFLQNSVKKKISKKRNDQYNSIHQTMMIIWNSDDRLESLFTLLFFFHPPPFIVKNFHRKKKNSASVSIQKSSVPSLYMCVCMCVQEEVQWIKEFHYILMDALCVCVYVERVKNELNWIEWIK